MRLASATAVCAGLLAVALPSAVAAPSADDRGYVDSTARCAAPYALVVFGSTDASRVAICKTPGGTYEYRGVRVSDGAKLIVPAEGSGDDSFVADSGGVRYLVTPKSLVLSAGTTVIREEPMVDFHGQPASAPAPSTPTSTTPLPPPLAAEKGGDG